MPYICRTLYFFMKKFSAWLLLMIILFHMGLFYPVFFLYKAEIKREVRARILGGDGQLLSKEATVMVLSEKAFKDLQWLEKEREFIFNGRLYDVISIQRDLQGKIKIVALEDGKEQALYQALKKRNEAGASRSGQVNLGLQFSLYCLPVHSIYQYIPYRIIILNGFQENSLILFEPGVPSPPPWFI